MNYSRTFTCHMKKFYLSLEFDKHIPFIWNKLEAAKGLFYKKDVLKNFAKFTRKYLFQSLLFIKVTR